MRSAAVWFAVLWLIIALSGGFSVAAIVWASIAVIGIGCAAVVVARPGSKDGRR